MPIIKVLQKLVILRSLGATSWKADNEVVATSLFSKVEIILRSNYLTVLYQNLSSIHLSIHPQIYWSTHITHDTLKCVVLSIDKYRHLNYICMEKRPEYAYTYEEHHTYLHTIISQSKTRVKGKDIHSIQSLHKLNNQIY